MNINSTVCTSCGACSKECPTFAVKKSESGFFIEREQCIECGHCAAVCPVQAVEGCIARPRREHLPKPADMLEFLLNKRSVRTYKAGQIREKDLALITASAMSAATASNTMDWQLHMFSGDILEQLRRAMLNLFVKNSRLVKAALTNPLFRLIGRLTAARPYVIRKKTADTFDGYLKEIGEGRDPLLFGAPQLMVLTSPKHTAAYGPANCAIAASQMIETAFTLGIGSCMVGFAENMINLFPKIKKMTGIDRKQKVFLVFTLGYSDVSFRAGPIREFPVFLNGSEYTEHKKQLKI